MLIYDFALIHMRSAQARAYVQLKTRTNVCQNSLRRLLTMTAKRERLLS